MISIRKNGPFCGWKSCCQNNGHRRRSEIWKTKKKHILKKFFISDNFYGCDRERCNKIVGKDINFFEQFLARRFLPVKVGLPSPWIVRHCSALWPQAVGLSNTLSPKMRGPIAVATGVGIASLRSLKSLFDELSRVPSTSFLETPSIVVLLVKEAMPIPVATAIDPLIVGDDPTTWEFKAPNNAEQFKLKADPLSPEEILTPKNHEKIDYFAR